MHDALKMLIVLGKWLLLSCHCRLCGSLVLLDVVRLGDMALYD